MAALRWSRQAADDLEEICDFIGRNSPRYAAYFAETALQIADEMAADPYGGWMVPEYQRPEIRERLLGSYRLIFRYHRQTVEIVTLVHGAKRLPPLTNDPSN